MAKTLAPESVPALTSSLKPYQKVDEVSGEIVSKYKYLGTPGPWKTDTYEHTVSESLYVTSETGILIGVGQYDISGTGRETASKIEGQANGYLIAAAPELLECLMLAVREEERGRNVMILASKEMGFDSPKKLLWVERAEAVLKKALGK